jgi:N-acetyl-gamma-glutamyl-phosphate reductase common form
MGGEALRLVLEHPLASLAWVTSRGDEDVVTAHPNLIRAEVKFVAPEAITPCDVAFVAAPTGVALEIAPRLLAMGCKVIDLGADFRLRDRGAWERVYGRPHAQWEIARRAVYGIAELHRDAIRAADVIANPGCYATAVILGLAPLVREGLAERRRLVATGLSGTAGMGADQSRPSHHPEIANNLVPYNVVDHRHTYEMEQELSALAGADVTVAFTPVYVPISRGILAICDVAPTRAVPRAELLSLYRDFYRGEYFVHVHDAPGGGETWNYRPYPWVSSVSGTNFCQIGLDVDERRGRIVVFSVLDSMGKGGAHAGVQNMNLAFGLDEKTGLARAGLHPY